MQKTKLAALSLVVAVMAAPLAACSGGDDPVGTSDASVATPSEPSTASSPSPSSSPSSSGPVPSTPQLDAIAVLGHSGSTGYDSDPSNPGADVRTNSWATGTNPDVDSVYQRLLGTHPALEGHTTSLGVDGSTVDDLAAQVDAMLALDPLPDVVLIQSIDNDMQCDGTDDANQPRFGEVLSAVLDAINQGDPGAQVFFVDQWGSVQTYTDATRHDAGAVASATGTGPCDTFTPDGKERPAGIASEQAIVDGYFQQIQTVCAAHPRCWTDGGALQKMPLGPGDLTSDRNHLSVRGLAVMATYAWEALPEKIKQRA